MVACMPNAVLINLAISMVAHLPNAVSNQPDHQHGDMYAKCSLHHPGNQHGSKYAKCSLKPTWSSAWWHVCPIQTQIILAISLVACVPSAYSNQPGHPHGGMYSQFRLKSTLPSAWWHVCPVQTQINLAISLVACVPSLNSTWS